MFIGRASVQTVGEARFEVVGEYGIHDGYSVATVKYVVDKNEEDVEELEAKREQLRGIVTTRLAQVDPLQILLHFGAQPVDDNGLLFWALQVPVFHRRITEAEQYTIMYGDQERTSPLHRLRAVLAIEAELE